jgi:hypothetical protein
MLARIVFVAFLALGIMVAVKSGTILRGYGLLASCETVEAPSRTGVTWEACRDGVIDGRRDLSVDCESLGVLADGREYWSCH